jgi:hypothetical protein
MAVIAGAYSRRRNSPLPKGLETAVVRAVSRRADRRREIWSGDGVVLVHCETGAYDAPAFVRQGTTSFTAVAGDPLMRGRADVPGRSRVEDTTRLHAALAAGDDAPLLETTGPFASVHYDAPRHALTLATDKLGYRAIYYWMSEDLVIFATSLHAIEALEAVPKHMNARGVLQLAPVGYMLGNGTPYANVKLVGPGEVMRFEDGAHTERRYFRLDRVPTSTRSVDELADDAMTALRGAVTRRLGADRTAVAFLTGGMDTRLIICELLRRDVALHTLNGAFPGNQDQIYARLFSSSVGTRHQEMPALINDPRFPTKMARCWQDSAARMTAPPEHPQLLWAGDGGSVGLGAVAIDATMLASLRAGRLRDAVHQFVAFDGTFMPRRVLTPAIRRRFVDVIEQGILDEYQSYEVDDPGRLPWIFTVFNEYRRAYMKNHEHVDLHGCELLEPLCDTDLLEVLTSVPIDHLLGHEFYMRLVERSDPRFLAAPWQTYEGHVACPVPAPADIPSQWDHQQIATRATDTHQGLKRRVLRAIFSRDFPAAFVGRARVLSAAALLLLGLRDTRHVLQFVDSLYHFFRVCGGRIVWSVMSALHLAEHHPPH